MVGISHEGTRALSFGQVAELTAVSRRTVRKWVADGDLPAVRISHQTVRILPADLAAFLAARREAPEDAKA
jgi:excisionase family DNA binding protein